MKRKEIDEEGKARALDRRDRTTVVMERSLSNDLREALKNLSVSQKRVKAVADLALMNSRDYKEIVHEIEKHISRTSAEKRLAGIYVVDAIIRGVRRVVSIIPLRENSPTSPPPPPPHPLLRDSLLFLPGGLFVYPNTCFVGCRRRRNSRHRVACHL